MKKKQINILEIGVYCGQNTVNLGCFFSENKANIEITCIDPWDKVVPEDKNKSFFYHSFFEDLKNNRVERMFDNNIRFSGLQNVVKKEKLFSVDFFKKNKKKFDLIIVDGSHYFDNVNHDIRESIKILNDDGILILDDYELEASKISFDELSFYNKVDLAIYKNKLTYHPGVTHAVKMNFSFNLSSHNGLGVVIKKNNRFSNFFINDV